MPVLHGIVLHSIALHSVALPLLAERQAPRFVHLTRDQGLSDNTVEAIAEDRRGFMWFGTADGLNRYDGQSFVTYRHRADDPTSLSDSFIFSLFLDSAGDFWVGTALGLNRYLPESDSFQRYGGTDDMLADTVYQIFEAANGELWLATNGGIGRFDPERSRFKEFQVNPEEPETHLLSYSSWAVLADSSDQVWIGAVESGLSRLDLASGRFQHYGLSFGEAIAPGRVQVDALLQGRDGKVWIGSRHGLYRYDAALDAFDAYFHDLDDEQSLPHSSVAALHEDEDGVLWIGTDGGGLSLYDREQDVFFNARHDPNDPTSLGGNVVRTIFEDNRGDLWIGLYTGGISFLNRDAAVFNYYRNRTGDPESLSDNGVISFFEEEDGTLWVGTENGLNLFHEATGTFTVYPHDARDPGSLSAPAVLSILRDARGTLWVGTYNGGLNRFDEEEQRFIHYLPDPENPASLSHRHVYGLHEDRQGRLWLATFNGISRMDPLTESFEVFRYDENDPTGPGNQIIWNFYEDSSGTLWLATPGGLTRYVAEEDHFRTYNSVGREPTTLSSVDVLAMLEDRTGRFWVGTNGGGLNLFDRETGDAEFFDDRHGLPSVVIFGILEDDRGRLWLSTNAGLAQFDPEVGECLLTLDKGDGVLASPFTRNAFLKRRNGELLFGGNQGFHRFDPALVHGNPHIPPVVLTDFQIFNEPAPFGAPGDSLQRAITEAQGIVLDYDQSVISLGFAVLNYRNPKGNQYAYRLEGFDESWNEAGGKNTATYTNLDSGSYTFRVRGANNSGLWNEEGASVEILVRPPFWGTLWFQSLATLGVLGLLVGGYQIRTAAFHRHREELEEEINERRIVEAKLQAKNAELEAKNAELEQFTYTVSHDLKSPLVTITGFTGMLENDALAGDMERVRKDAAYIRSATDKMQQLLSELLSLARVGRKMSPPERTPLTDLAYEAASRVAGEVIERGVEVRIDEDLPLVWGDRTRIVEVFQNLISNSVRFMGDQESPVIEVRAEIQDADGQGGEVLCSVRDNGIGIEERYHQKVFGLFERLDAKTEGTGIGLALVKRIVEVHGGRIWLESEVGQGTTFFFTLPYSQDNDSSNLTE